LMRRFFQGSNAQFERAFTLSGGLVSLVFAGLFLFKYLT
jgi:hypothetical protein